MIPLARVMVTWGLSGELLAVRVSCLGSAPASRVELAGVVGGAVVLIFRLAAVSS